jgi:integral membrane protein
MKYPLIRFKWVAFLEGTSFLILLFICMPLKYGFDIFWPNKIMGMAHGVLTVLYVFSLIDFGLAYRISFLRYVQFFMASLLPFGTFYAERKWLRPLAEE